MKNGKLLDDWWLGEVIRVTGDEPTSFSYWEKVDLVLLPCSLSDVWVSIHFNLPKRGEHPKKYYIRLYPILASQFRVLSEATHRSLFAGRRPAIVG